MLSWVLQITILSIILIFLVHHLFEFFKTTLTVPKIKDLVNSPMQKYETMFQSMSKSEHSGASIGTSKHADYIQSLLPKPDVESMKNELKNFLKSQSSGNKSIVSAADLDSSSYSSY